MTLTVLEPIGELEIGGEKRQIYRCFKVEVTQESLPQQLALWYDGGLKPGSFILDDWLGVKGVTVSISTCSYGYCEITVWARLAYRACWIANACHVLMPQDFPIPINHASFSAPFQMHLLATDPHSYPGWRVPAPK